MFHLGMLPPRNNVTLEPPIGLNPPGTLRPPRTIPFMPPGGLNIGGIDPAPSTQVDPRIAGWVGNNPIMRGQTYSFGNQATDQPISAASISGQPYGIGSPGAPLPDTPMANSILQNRMLMSSLVGQPMPDIHSQPAAFNIWSNALGHILTHQRGLADMGLRRTELLGINGIPGTLARQAQNATADQLLRQGELAWKQAELQGRLGQGGRRAAMEQFLLQQPGMTPEQAASIMRRAVERGMFSGEVANLPALPIIPGLPGQTNQVPPLATNPVTVPGQPTAPGRPLTNPYQQQQRGQEPEYLPIQSSLDEILGVSQQHPAGAAVQSTGIGEFLARLDNSRPGFVRQNWPAIRAYIRERWGIPAFNRAAQGTTRAGPFVTTPFEGRSGGFARLLSPILTTGEAIGSLFDPELSNEQTGRAMLRNLLNQR